MSKIKAQIQDDIKESMKSGNKQALDAYRLLLSAIITAEKSEGVLDDAQVTKILEKERKKREDSLTMYVNAGAEEKAQVERFEIEILDKFLPKRATEDEISIIVMDIIGTLDGGFDKTKTKIVMEKVNAISIELGIIIDKKIVSQYLNRL